MNSGETYADTKRKKGALALLLSFLMIFSILAVNIPPAFAGEETQTTETAQPSEEIQPGETPQAPETAQPSEEIQPGETPQAPETAQPSEESRPGKVPQVIEALPPDAAGTAGISIQKAGMAEVLDKSKLNGSQKKLSTKLLQLTDNKFLIYGKTKSDLLKEMEQQKQIKFPSGRSLASGVTGEPGISETKVYVYIKLKKGANFDILSPFESGQVNRDAENRFEAAWVSVDSLESIANLEGVQNVKEVMPPVVHTGSIVSQGDSVLKAMDMRAQTGYDGTGIKIGIISDGVNHWAESKATGDLPADFTSANILRNSLGGDEGTAMMEIVYDLAPGATLYFRDAGNDIIDFNEGIDELINAGCNIICDDIGWIEEPYFEDGTVAQHVANVLAAKKIIYVTAAGNDAKKHFQGLFYNDGYSYNDFSRGTNEYFQYLYADLAPGEDILVFLQWDDRFGQSGNDYDLCLFDYDSERLIAFSGNVQNGNDDPVEWLYYRNKSKEFDVSVEIDVYKAPLANAKTLELYIDCDDLDSQNLVSSDSIYGHAAVPGVITCGAADQTAPTIAEYYSSCGPVTMLGETRQKPDICGVDRVAVTGVGGLPKPFSGTSAAAPHIAAIAALLKSRFPGMSTAQIKQTLINSANDIGVSGYDYACGYGRANAFNAAFSYLYVTFDSQGGSSVSKQLIAKGQKAAQPAVPKRSGYRFGGWYTNTDFAPSHLWDFNNAVTADTKLYAKWSTTIVTISADGTYDLRDYGDNSIININSGLAVTFTTGNTTCHDMQIVCGEGVVLTADSLDITSMEYSGSCPISFTGNGNELILSKNSHLTSGNNSPTVRVEQGTSLSISGSGSLYTYTGAYNCAAAIGGGNGKSCGILTIAGGNIDANGYKGAGIGGGAQGGGGIITITGGKIDAKGSPGAGIGGGLGGTGGSITISGGTVIAYGNQQCDIGYGYKGSGGYLSISGNSAVILKHGTSVTPATTTHTKHTLAAAPGGLIYGKIPAPSAWAAPYYIYANDSEISVLTFDANGGAGTTPASVTQYIGTRLALPDGAGLVKNRLAFVSWNTRADGLGDNYAPGAMYTYIGTDALYAKYADPVRVTGVEISGADIMTDGDTQTLVAAVLPEDATYPEITWTSGNAAVAAVDQNGAVTAVFPGTAKITAAADGISDTFDITVIKKPVTSVELSSEAETLTDGDTFTLSAAVLPPDATYSDVTWSSDNEAAATVDENGVVTAMFPGAATIKVAADELYDTCAITVAPLRVSDVVFSSGEVDIGIGKTQALSAAVLPAGATYPELTWESDAPDVVSVDESGNVTANAFGSACITATADGKSDTCTVNVKCDISALPNDPVYGSVSGAGFYSAGNEVTLTATPAAGCRFIHWTENGEEVSAARELMFTAAGNRTLTAEFADIGVPAAMAVCPTYNSVSLTWGALSEATAYEVWRASSASGTYAKVSGEAGLTVTSFTDENLTPCKTYYYKVRGYHAAGGETVYGRFSGAVSARPAPFAPGDFAAASAGYNRVKISWSASGGATGYQLYRSTSEYGTYSLIKTTTALSYTNTYLYTGKTYYYKVRAYTGSTSVAGNFSNVVSATPVLNEMSGVKAATYYPTAIKISWNAVPGRTSYQVYRSETPDGEYKYIGSTTYTYYKNTGLAVDKTYYYKVRAYRTVGTKRVYNDKCEYVYDTTRVFQAKNVKAIMYSVTSNKLTWSAVPGASGYEIIFCDAEGNALAGRNNAATIYTYYYDKKLVPNATYHYKVKAYRTVGTVRHYGPESDPISATPVFKDVTNVKALMYSVNSNKISWNSVSGRTGYEVSWSESEDGIYTKLPVTTYTYIYHKGIDPAKTYYYKVAAYVTVNGVRQYSAESAPVRAYNKVNGVKGYMYSVTSNKICWSSVASRSRYEVWWSDSKYGTYTMLPATTYTYIYHKGIDPEKTYHYKVLAYQIINGDKVYTNDADIVEVLNKVRGAKAACYSYKTNKISWSSVSGRDYYAIYRYDADADDYVYLGKTGYTYYYDKNLTTDTTYYYKVCAYDTVGGVKTRCGFSDVVSATPKLKAVSGARAYRYTSTKIKLTWYAVPGATGYEIERCTTGAETDFVNIKTTTTTTAYYYNGGLVKGTKYYYRIRAYRTAGENTYHGGWSKVVYATP